MQGWLLTACCDPSAQGTQQPAHHHKPQQAGPPSSDSPTRLGWAGLPVRPPLLPRPQPHLRSPRCGPWEMGWGLRGGVGGVSTPHLGLQWARGVPTAPGCQED